MDVSNIFSIFSKDTSNGKQPLSMRSMTVDFENMLRGTAVGSRVTEKQTVLNVFNEVQGLQELQHPLTQLELSVQYITAVRDKVQSAIEKLTGIQI